MSVDKPCPSCGYCPTCGRQRYTSTPYWYWGTGYPGYFTNVSAAVPLATGNSTTATIASANTCTC